MKTIDQYANNCTLVAVREISGRSDEEIIDGFLKKGWRPGRGAYTYQYYGVLSDLGIEMERVNTVIEGRSAYVMTKATEWEDGEYRANSSYYMTARQFAEAYPEGVYLVASSGHAFVVRDGVIVDPNLSNKRTRQRIVSAMRIVNPAPSRYTFVKSKEITKDTRVRFEGVTRRRQTSKSFAKEVKAWYVARKTIDGIVTVGELTKGTGYTMDYAKWDIAKGRLVVVD